MSYSITVASIRPAARNAPDQLPWASVKVEEGATSVGPWSTIDTQSLTPLDEDPTLPQLRTVTTDNATLEAGWYRFTFADADSDQGPPTSPVHYDPIAAALTPSVYDVALLLLARSRNAEGERPTFDSTTRPTDSQAADFINAAYGDVTARLPVTTPTRLHPLVRNLIAARAAMLIEAALFPEQAADTDSTFHRLRDLYTDDLSFLAGEAASADTYGASVYSVKITSPFVNVCDEAL